MFASKDIFLKSSGGYQISRSVRLRSSASAYFNRTPASAGSRTTWTWSAWVKRGQLTRSTTGGVIGIFGGGTLGVSQSNFVCYFNSSFDIYLQETVNNVSNQLIYQTTSLYRDPSAWYHIIIAMDTTQATAANRTKVYVNGVQAPGAFSVTPAQNQALSINNTVPQYIGGASVNPQAYGNVLSYFDGYLTEINFIDGQALTPSSFGSTNTVTGVWQPIKYTGTYGTNGFYLNFSDNSGVTATTIGKDYSGNGNNWTPNNISITAGATYDSMIDVPTPYADGGNGRGNYAVLNPLQLPTAASTVLSNANLLLTCNSGTSFNSFANGTIYPTSGKYYAEFYINTVGETYVGISRFTDASTPNSWNSQSTYYNRGGVIQKDNATIFSVATYTTGDTIGVAYDVDNATCAFYKNNTLVGTVTGVTAGSYTFSIAGYLSAAISFNTGQRPFTYTPPTGFVALNTQNLPTPTISNGALYMAATLYAANGSTQTISNAVNGVSFQPDWVWVKSRQYTTVGHSLFDALRPIGVNSSLPRLVSNSTDAETNNGGLTAFVSNGFSLNNDAYINSTSTGGNMVAWQWNAGGSTVTNTSGTISSQVRANATAGFSIVTCTFGNGSIGHGLGVAPKMIIGKGRGPTTGNWIVFHSGLANMTDKYLNLNGTAAVATLGTAVSAPTSTLFYGNGGYLPNAESAIFYCFAAVAGYSAFGSYTGNGVADGVFVYLGFRPRFIMIKSTSASTEWVMIDTSRSSYNLSETSLYANRDYSESTIGTVNDIDILSNGFKLRNNTGFVNASQTYIYAAFSEVGFKYALGR